MDLNGFYFPPPRSVVVGGLNSGATADQGKRTTVAGDEDRQDLSPLTVQAVPWT